MSSSESSDNNALTHGLEILRLLAESAQPMTSTEIAARVGLHQSSASRILKTLSAAGYVRKPSFHSFSVDLGVLTLGGSALRHFPLATRPQAALSAVAQRCPELLLSVASMWRGQMIYFLRLQARHEPTLLSVGSFPLHLSSPALRLLLGRPEAEALEILNESKRRYGWERPTAAVPANAAGVLAAARKLLRHDCLPLENWQAPDRLSVAIPVAVPGQPEAALALSGPTGEYKIDTILLLLQDARRAVEESFRQDSQPRKFWPRKSTQVTS